MQSSLDGGLDVQEYDILSYPHYKTCEFHLAYGPQLDGNLYKNLYTQGKIIINSAYWWLLREEKSLLAK